MAGLESHNMDDRELAVEQRMFLALRKQKGLTLSSKMGGGHNLTNGKTANQKALNFLEFSYLTIDKRTDKTNELF